VEARTLREAEVHGATRVPVPALRAVAPHVSVTEPARPGTGVLPALVLPPRRIHVQGDGERPLGHVPWEVHAEACARLGGLGWREMREALGRVPEGWREW